MPAMSEMLDETHFKKVMRDIVMEHFPDELTPFDLEIDSMLNELSAESSIQQAAGRGEFQFVGDATSILTFVSLLGTTFLTLQKCYDRVRQPEVDTLRKSWKRELEKAGMSAKKAEAITDK